MIVKIDVGVGEAIDRLTILEIKLERIADPMRRDNVARDYSLLSQALVSIPETQVMQSLRANLKKINEALWQVEDDLRDHERRQDFGPEFVRLARAVYHSNDRRAQVKREINELVGSVLNEEKSYAAYTAI